MADQVKIGAVINLPPEETVRAFDARGELRTSVRWSEMFHEDHARAFTVAKVAKLDLLETIRTSLADVIHNGGTFEQWKAHIVPDLERAGWWGRVQDRELTGTDEAVTISPSRLRTIYSTNLRVSRAAGQWARIQELKDVAPYLRYSAVMDRRTRPLHRAWHGIILPVDHPWWDTHFPPCGWNCRCTVIQLSERDLKKNGWTVAKEPPPAGPPQTFFRAGSTKPEIVPAGIDPGFAYNPGKASMRAIADKAAATLEREAGRDLGGARAALRDLVDSPAFPQAMAQPGTAFPVMILDAETSALIGSVAQVATLSAEVFAKLQRRPELDLALFRQLPAIGATADLVARQGDSVLIGSRLDGDSWFMTLLALAEGAAALLLQGFRIQNRRSVNRLLRRSEVLRDGRSE